MASWNGHAKVVRLLLGAGLTINDVRAENSESLRLAIVKGFDSLIESSKQTLTTLKSPEKSLEASPTMVYWQDDDGEHSFFTEKVKLG